MINLQTAKAIVLSKIIKNNGGQPYFTGGYVRDTLLGQEPKDIDIVVTDITMATLQKAFPDGKLAGKDFPVLIVDGVEIALARKERKIGRNHTDFTCETEGVQLFDDLYRRDLTINAIAMDPFNGVLIDPFNGRKDIEDCILRPVSDHFVEDPLRVLRAARFAAQFGFKPTHEMRNMCESLHNEMQYLTPERVFIELQKALRASTPSLFFKTLDDFGCLEVLFPELFALKGRIQPEKHHPEGDSYVHCLLVIDRASELGANDATMFASLCHDYGKAVTDDSNLPHHFAHEQLGIPIVRNFCDRLKVPSNLKEIALSAIKEHLNIHKFLDLRPTTKVRLLERLGAAHGNSIIEQVTLVAQADAQGRGPLFHNKPYPQRQAIFDAAEKFRSIRGDQFAHLKDGHKIHQKLEQERAKLLK